MDVQIMSVDQFYHNGITTLSGHVDLMLAELPLPDVQVAILNRAKTKLTCADRLVEKQMYPESLALETDAVFDIAEIVEFLGLKEVANSIRSSYANL